MDFLSTSPLKDVIDGTLSDLRAWSCRILSWSLVRNRKAESAKIGKTRAGKIMIASVATRRRNDLKRPCIRDQFFAENL